jgi:hypothetical protein
MATASQKITLNDGILYLTKFLDLILGAFTAAPKILAPAMKIPLNYQNIFYQAAPITEAANAIPIPVYAHEYGEIP